MLTNAFAAWHSDRRIPPRKELVARILLSSLAIATCALALTATATFTYSMVHQGGWLARVSIIAMAVLGAFLLADTIVNDVLPVRFQLRWTRRARQGMWMALGLIFILFAYQVLTAGFSKALGTYLVLYGLCSFIVAFIDAAVEKMDRRRCGT